MDAKCVQQTIGKQLYAESESRVSPETPGISRFWQKTRLLLSMLAGSLIVIAATVQLLFLYQQRVENDHTGHLGQNLARLMADVPYEDLDTTRVRNLFQKAYDSQTGSRLAYISLVDHDGVPIHEIAAPGINIPGAALSRQPANWYGEYSVTLPDNQVGREFFAPWLVGTEMRGFVRLAYFVPGPYSSWQEPYTLVLIAIFSFVQALLLYAFVLREVGKHKEALDELEATTGAGKSLPGLLEGLNDYIGMAKRRIADLEDERATLLTSSSVATYQYNKTQAILHTIPDGILVVDDTGTIIFANKSLAALFDTQHLQIQEKPLSSWCSDESVRQYLRPLLSPAASARAKTEFIIEREEETKTLEISSHPIFGADVGQGRKGLLVLVKDHTQQSLDETNRKEFVAHICHELKTPLNTLSMYSEVLLDEDNATEEFRLDAVNIIYDETHRMKDLINNLLNLTRIEMGNVSINRQRVKLHDFLLDIYSNITSGAEKSGLNFRLDIPNGLEDIAVDKTLFRIVITNLMTNAIKYNRPEGEVLLKAEETDTSVTVSVCDTGIGISEEDRKKIFEKFFRSTEDNVRQISGHGLGLALVRDIVQMHNGTLTVKSEPGKGSEFVVEIRKDPELLMKVG